MSTVRSIERRLYVRRMADRELATQAATVAGEVPRPMEWSGVWTGYMVFVGIAVLLLSFVFGIGFSSLNPLESSSWSGVGAGAMAWSLVALLLATFLGAWVAGGTPATTRRHGIMRGITLWGLILLTALLLVGWVTGTAVAATSGVAGAALGNAPNLSAARVTSVLQGNGINNITAAQASTISAQLMSGDRAGAANTLATNANIPTARAQSILDQVTAPVAGAATSAGQAVKQGGTSVSWGLFWMALLGLGCAILGGASGGGGRELRRLIRPGGQPA
ncbi:MAG TPA: hypothetical protein VMV31_09600 [Terriglobales bacterium]|nr:hypothetical protein [Terriglobales bacterium]